MTPEPFTSSILKHNEPSSTLLHTPLPLTWVAVWNRKLILVLGVIVERNPLIHTHSQGDSMNFFRTRCVATLGLIQFNVTTLTYYVPLVSSGHLLLQGPFIKSSQTE